jgi:hypothetical protein
MTIALCPLRANGSAAVWPYARHPVVQIDEAVAVSASPLIER